MTKPMSRSIAPKVVSLKTAVREMMNREGRAEWPTRALRRVPLKGEECQCEE